MGWWVVYGRLRWPNVRYLLACSHAEVCGWWCDCVGLNMGLLGWRGRCLLARINNECRVQMGSFFLPRFWLGEKVNSYALTEMGGVLVIGDIDTRL